jgi:hypothetical protein
MSFELKHQDSNKNRGVYHQDSLILKSVSEIVDFDSLFKTVERGSNTQSSNDTSQRTEVHEVVEKVDSCVNKVEVADTKVHVERVTPRIEGTLSLSRFRKQKS